MDRFRLEKLLDAVASKLPAVARLTIAAKRRERVEAAPVNVHLPGAHPASEGDRSLLVFEFRSGLLARIKSAHVGDPADPATEVGPLVNEKQLDEVLAAIERGRDQGGTVIAGGHRTDDEGYVIAPTLFEDVADESFLSCEEVFGPVSSLYRFETIDEAIERANAVRFGLSASVYTTKLKIAQQRIDQLESGILHVNSQTAGAEVHVPFGGTKESGFGTHEQGSAAHEFYTEEITVYQDV